MKKKVILIACALIIASSVTVLCNQSLNLSFQIPTDFENVTEPDFELATELTVEPISSLQEEFVAFSLEAESAIMPLDRFIKEITPDDNDRKRIENRFISALTEFRMTTEELKHITTLANENYDVEKLLDIYEFIRYTNSDMDMLAEIYREGEEKSDREHWIYDTYDILLGRSDDMLTVEDISHYVSQGLSVEEIAGAYQLSFTGEKNTREILAERLDGETWNTIAAALISENPEVIESAPEMTINDILACHSRSVRMRQDVSDIFTFDNNSVSLTDEAAEIEREICSIKHSLIEKYDAALPSVIEPQSDNIISDSVSSFSLTNDEYLFEEDLIPMEEPEVE